MAIKSLIQEKNRNPIPVDPFSHQSNSSIAPVNWEGNSCHEVRVVTSKDNCSPSHILDFCPFSPRSQVHYSIIDFLVVIVTLRHRRSQEPRVDGLAVDSVLRVSISTRAVQIALIMKVIIEPYNPVWVAEFQKARATLETILKDVQYISIEHVGSTSIPGLLAKPVIDIDLIIEPSSLVAARTALVSAGYTDCGEIDIPGRHAYRRPGYGKHQGAHGERNVDGGLRRNTYLMIEGCAALRNHLGVRRVLREDAKLRDEYGNLKRALADREFEGIGEYADGKSNILRKS